MKTTYLSLGLPASLIMMLLKTVHGAKLDFLSLQSITDLGQAPAIHAFTTPVFTADTAECLPIDLPNDEGDQFDTVVMNYMAGVDDVTDRPVSITLYTTTDCTLNAEAYEYNLLVILADYAGSVDFRQVLRSA